MFGIKGQAHKVLGFFAFIVRGQKRVAKYSFLIFICSFTRCFHHQNLQKYQMLPLWWSSLEKYNFRRKKKTLNSFPI